MNLLPNHLRLYAVTDRSWLPPDKKLTDFLEILLQNGVSCVQLREKALSDDELLSDALAVKALCQKYRVPFIINDRPDIAKRVKADGVHVGLSDMGIANARALLGPDYIIGGSAHNVTEARAAEAAGANYIGCGAVFGSTTKTDAGTLPISVLKDICQAVSIPVVAIGGISAENISALTDTGIAGAAVISALFAAQNPAEAAKTLSIKLSTLSSNQLEHCQSSAEKR